MTEACFAVVMVSECQVGHIPVRCVGRSWEEQGQEEEECEMSWRRQVSNLPGTMKGHWEKRGQVCELG